MQEPIVIQVETEYGNSIVIEPSGLGICLCDITERDEMGNLVHLTPLTRDEATRLRDALNMILNQNK